VTLDTSSGTSRPMRSVPVEVERSLIVDVLLALGATDETAAGQADQLVEGDLRGHPSHGLQRLPMLVRRIRNGVIDPATTGEHVWRTRTALTVDGGMGLGPPVALRALDAILERSREEGMALAAISNANHLGMLAPLVQRAADQGAICLASTTSEPLVHAWGGREAAVGTNPLALGVPAGGTSFVLDMATGEISRGKVIDHANRNAPLPPGSVVDSAGNPTTDPQEALAGAIAPFGGAKGYALSVGLQLLVGAMTVSALGRSVVGTLDATEQCNKGDLLVCFAPEVVSGIDRSGALAAFVEELRQSPPRDPSRPVEVPGDRSRRARAERLATGRVVVSEAVWTDVSEIATSVGVDIAAALIEEVDGAW
jgi:L-2-hydroxycarboxylate dehydrogenase (NAD+)